MIIKLFDKTEIIVTKEEATKVAEAINRGVKMIAIKGNLINPSAIALIREGGQTQADNFKKLDRPDFRGKDSPAKEKLRQQIAQMTKAQSKI